MYEFLFFIGSANRSMGIGIFTSSCGNSKSPPPEWVRFPKTATLGLVLRSRQFVGTPHSEHLLFSSVRLVSVHLKQLLLLFYCWVGILKILHSFGSPPVPVHWTTLIKPKPIMALALPGPLWGDGCATVAVAHSPSRVMVVWGYVSATVLDPLSPPWVSLWSHCRQTRCVTPGLLKMIRVLSACHWQETSLIIQAAEHQGLQTTY